MDNFSRNADSDDSENKYNDDTDEENSSTSSEIPFSLHGKNGQS